MIGPTQNGGMNFQPQRLDIRLQSGNGIELEKGNFEGDIQNAMTYLQTFCADPQNTISIRSRGRGYGTVTVNGVDHSYTPYGIDLKMMLEFCGGKTAKDFP